MAGTPSGGGSPTSPEERVLYIIAAIVIIISIATIAVVQLIVSDDHKLDPVLVAFIGGPLTLIITARLIGGK